MHFGKAVGTVKDAEKVREALRGTLDVLVKSQE